MVGGKGTWKEGERNSRGGLGSPHLGQRVVGSEGNQLAHPHHQHSAFSRTQKQNSECAKKNIGSVP